jgi:transcriptional antiterminator NusG
VTSDEQPNEPTESTPLDSAPSADAATAEVNGAAQHAEAAGENSIPVEAGVATEAAATDGTDEGSAVVKIAKPKKRKSAAEIQAEADAADDAAAASKQWYILKVATNREDSIRDALQRRVAMEGLDKYFGDIVVPVEIITEFKNGKKRNTKRKLFPGYIVVNMLINDETWYVVRETSGIGDFTGAMGRPTPMSPADVAKLIPKAEAGAVEAPKTAIKYKQGDRVRIKEGMFANFEGAIEAIDETNGRVTVIVNIFGRSTPVDIEYWLVEAVD